jgi:hypothetical protein
MEKREVTIIMNRNRFSDKYSYLCILCFTITLISFSCGGGGEGGGGDNIIPAFTQHPAIAIADLDNDGKPDLALVSADVSGAPPHPGYVSVIIQDPSRPGTFLPAVTYNTGNNPQHIAIGDLNTDSRPDLVVANHSASGSGTSSLSIFRQDPNRPGVFFPAIDEPLSKPEPNITIGNINTDSQLDLAIVSTDGLRIFFQDPLSPKSTSYDEIIGVRFSSVAIGDLNNDGRPDLVATAEDHVSVFLHDPVISGMFLPPVNYAAGPQPVSVVLGDLTNSGHLDIVTINFGTPGDPDSSVSILFHNPNSLGTFLPAIYYSTAGQRAYSMAIGDLNGDGNLDMAVANSGINGGTGNISILFQDPANPGHFLPAVGYPGRTKPLSIAIGDLNGDGKLDLAVADGGAAILFQDPDHPGKFLNSVLVGQ